jgi:aminoglycoside phosphotransferase (APT) family kinase protein
MDEVHKSHNLHNDISPDNILLHFPADESRVYIGVCDWGMTTKSTEPMKSLYAFTDTIFEAKELAKRWWVDPRVAYVCKEGADV